MEGVEVFWITRDLFLKVEKGITKIFWILKASKEQQPQTQQLTILRKKRKLPLCFSFYPKKRGLSRLDARFETKQLGVCYVFSSDS